MMHNGHEFEDRDSQLPADTRTVGGGAAPGALDSVPLGTPDIDYDVRSTYDVRPVSGFDFTFSQSVPMEQIGESAGRWTFNFEVPTGYVAVVRWYQWISSGNMSGPTSCKGTLLRNAVRFAHNIDVYLSPQSERMPVFMLVDEGQNFGVQVSAQSVFSGGPSDGALNIHGNLILKTGRAYQYEIANPVGVMRKTVLAPEPLYQPAPPPPPKEIIREIIREVSTPARQIPAAPPPPPATPPWKLEWIKQTSFSAGRSGSGGGRSPTVNALSFDAGNGMFWVPVVSLKGGRSSRGLTEEEAQMYRQYIEAHRPSNNSGGGGRTNWGSSR